MPESKKRSLDCIFKPSSVAVVGASKSKAKFGGRLVRNLIGYEFEGTVFPVNQRASFIQSIKCYPSVGEIPDTVDMAVISVPKEQVIEVAEKCGKKGIRALVVITAGFKEIGGEGLERERALMEVVRRYDMRIVGPNCMGVLNTEEKVRLNATFGPASPLPGRVSFLSQSGAMGVAIIGLARQIGLGLSKFASVGNKADVSGNDLLEYWRDDPETDVILMYLESFGNPRKFPMIARETSRKKPVVVVKAGRTKAGALAASSHTGALAGMDVAIDALFDQCGVLRVTSIEELFDVGKGLVDQPLPRGKRVAVLTNAGGPAIMATDALVSSGLEMAELSEKTKEALRGFLPSEASVANPVDMIAGATREKYERSLGLLLDDENVDSVLVIYVTIVEYDNRPIAEGVAEVMEKRRDKTVLACFMGQDAALPSLNSLRRARVPVFVFPESAIKALHAMYRYRKWRELPQAEIVAYPVDRAKARELIAKALARGEGYLPSDEVTELLEIYGIPTLRTHTCATAEEAAEAAERIGYPVVMKVSAEDIVHKSDVGGVMVDLKNELEVHGAFGKIMGQVERSQGSREGVKVIVQEMVKGGREMIIGMTLDPSFGPLVMFGLGGIYVEVLKDVVFRVCPVSLPEAQEMIRGIRSYPLLKGVRGAEPVNEEAIAEVITRISQMVMELHSIAELDINPFMAFPERARCIAVDARIRVKHQEPKTC